MTKKSCAAVGMGVLPARLLHGRPFGLKRRVRCSSCGKSVQVDRRGLVRSHSPERRGVVR